jgi:membrane protease subunit HflK
VNNALGETARFNALYREYIKAPEVTKRRIYLETMERSFPRQAIRYSRLKAEETCFRLLQMQLTQKQ